MSKKHDFQLKKWQCLIKECKESGLKITDWCAANGVSRYQYYYWLDKIQEECYEMAVNQLPITKVSAPMEVKATPFVEIKHEVVSEAAIPVNQPAAIVQKGRLRIEIMPTASAIFIKQLLEAVHYA